MTKVNKIKLRMELADLTQTFEGNFEDAFKFLYKFITQVYPGFKYTSKFIYSPDHSRLLENLPDHIQVTEDGTFLFVHQPESTEQAIGTLLSASKLSHKIGVREKDTMPTSEIIQNIDKAPKTIRNTLAYMVRSKLVERVSKGEYKMTVKGIKWIEENLGG